MSTRETQRLETPPGAASAARHRFRAAGAPRRTKPSLSARRAAVVLTAALVVAGCGSSASTTADTTTTQDAPSTTAADATGAIVNVWQPADVDPTRLPIGDSSVSTSETRVAGLYACSAGNAGAGGASTEGPWLDTTAGTWDSTTKLAVEGNVSWPAAEYTETVTDGQRVLRTNDLPVDGPTGTFPIATDDPSYAYDRNPGTITATATTVTIDEQGSETTSPSCMSEGAVGLLRNGVFLFNALDGRGDDAVAHESQDLCNGHPAMTTYHYHNVPSCIRDATTGPSTVVGWAYDGFPIVVERDDSGALPSNADLDECHGRTSPILLDGAVVIRYHYSVTLEFPYTLGCWKGTPAPGTNTGAAAGPPTGGPAGQ